MANKDLEKKIESCIMTAVASGAPRDQTERFITSGYIPLPWQWEFHAAAREADLPGGPVDIGLGGARGPGKSHAVLSQAALDDCQRVPGLKGLFLRQTGVSAKESFDDLVGKVVRGHIAMEKQQNILKFPNGSRIILGGFRTESDIDKYTGIEYDFIIVEELNQLTEEKYKKLRGSLRTTKTEWRPRMYTSFNPGGVGHGLVKNRYVIPHRERNEKETRFIGGTYKMNPYLNPEYTDYLEGLGGTLGKAWREGDFDLFEGMYFMEWRYDKHVVRENRMFTIPVTWLRYRSIDPGGRDGITSCHWYAVDGNGRVWVYREYYYGPDVIDPKTGEPYGTGRDHDQHAEAIYAMSCDEDGVEEQYRYSVIDTSAFAKAGYSETVADIYARKGVKDLVPAAKERVVGWNAVHTYLRWKEDEKEVEPKLQIFPICTNMIRTLPLLQHDVLHPEDVDSDGEDHGGDELRYFLRTLRETKAPRPQNVIERKLANLRSRQTGQGFDYQYHR